MYAFHTGSKGWHDIAYNFLVDREGGVWEGRAGSLAGPVAADATGGSQGFDQLVCFIGDFTSVMPTPAAVDAGNRTLAWLAQRYSIDTAAGSTVTFVSRGSNKWPAGAKVTTATVAGHREMSTTACPGNAFYPYVRNQMQAAVDGTELACSRGGEHRSRHHDPRDDERRDDDCRDDCAADHRRAHHHTGDDHAAEPAPRRRPRRARRRPQPTSTTQPTTTTSGSATAPASRAVARRRHARGQRHRHPRAADRRGDGRCRRGARCGSAASATGRRSGTARRGGASPRRRPRRCAAPVCG